jgi:hypothetical protein
VSYPKPDTANDPVHLTTLVPADMTVEADAATGLAECAGEDFHVGGQTAAMIAADYVDEQPAIRPFSSHADPRTSLRMKDQLVLLPPNLRGGRSM